MGKFARWNLAASAWRHFDQADGLPYGLVPIGDAICRFNPTHGQGMSVAAKEAVLLPNLIRQSGSERDPLAGLGQMFQAEAAQLIATPRTMAAIPDLAFPQTMGERPDDLEESLELMEGLSRIAAKDGKVHRQSVEVWHLCSSRTASTVTRNWYRGCAPNWLLATERGGLPRRCRNRQPWSDHSSHDIGSRLRSPLGRCLFHFVQAGPSSAIVVGHSVRYGTEKLKKRPELTDSTRGNGQQTRTAGMPTRGSAELACR